MFFALHILLSYHGTIQVSYVKSQGANRDGALVSEIQSAVTTDKELVVEEECYSPTAQSPCKVTAKDQPEPFSTTTIGDVALGLVEEKTVMVEEEGLQPVLYKEDKSMSVLVTEIKPLHSPAVVVSVSEHNYDKSQCLPPLQTWLTSILLDYD